MEATLLTSIPLRIKPRNKVRRQFQCNSRQTCAKTCTLPKSSIDSKFSSILHAGIKTQQANQHLSQRTPMFRNSIKLEAIKPGKTRDFKWYRGANKKAWRGKICHCSKSRVTCRPVYSRSRMNRWSVSRRLPRRWGPKRGHNPLSISLNSIGKRHKRAVKSSFVRWTLLAKSLPKSKSNRSLRQGRKRWLLRTLSQCLERRAVLDKSSRST